MPVMKMNSNEFRQMVRELAMDDRVQKMKTFPQHGSVSTYGHCLRVAFLSYRIARRFGICIDEEAMVRGALLHDYYLYDWHEPGHTRHAAGHAAAAAENARRDFDIGDREFDIIRSHMWPISPGDYPGSREALIVCAADKLCTLEETLFMR